MAFINTSDSILIRATLTDEGKKLLARGEFKVAKFALGDDEFNYSLIDPDKIGGEDVGAGVAYAPASDNLKILECGKNKHKNIQFGLNSFDNGVVYLDAEEITFNPNHAHIMYLPRVLPNNKLSNTPTITGSMTYISVNDETSQILSDIENLRFLRSGDYDACKLVVESGMDFGTQRKLATDGDAEVVNQFATRKGRENLILRKFLLDSDFYVYADNRFITGFTGMHKDSEFKNFKSGEVIIKFLSIDNVFPISIESEFENYATYILSGIPNLLYEFDTELDDSELISKDYSVLNGPRGSILACNPKINQQMKITSTGTRDFRFTEFGKTDQIVFSELPTKTFDYIDTSIYFVGATSNSRLTIPVRIVRYTGTV